MGASLHHPTSPHSQCSYPQGLVPDGDPAELQCPAFGRRRHIAAPVLRPLATLMEGAGHGYRAGRGDHQPPGHPETNSCTTPTQHPPAPRLQPCPVSRGQCSSPSCHDSPSAFAMVVGSLGFINDFLSPDTACCQLFQWDVTAALGQRQKRSEFGESSSASQHPSTCWGGSCS